MAITAILLAGALVPTGFIREDRTHAAFPAMCLYHPKSPHYEGQIGTYNGWYIGVTFAFLLITYVSRVLQLFPKATDAVYNTLPLYFKSTFQSWIQTLERRARASTSPIAEVQWACLHRSTYSLYCVLITWLLAALIWGSIRIISDRLMSSYPNNYHEVDEENRWGFGQVIAVVLLLVPFSSFVELSYDTLSRRKKADHYTNPDADPKNAKEVHKMDYSLVPQDMHGRTDPYPGYDIGSTAQPDLPVSDLYSHRWFRKLILLLYCFCIVIAGLILVAFPAADVIKKLKYAGLFIIGRFPLLIAACFVCMWIFALAGVSSLNTDPMPQHTATRWIRRELLAPRTYLEERLFPSTRRLVTTIAWNGLVLGLAATAAGLGMWLIVSPLFE
ncbi:hypothetical protein ACLMJK_005314 [Lecanora helva]